MLTHSRPKVLPGLSAKSATISAEVWLRRREEGEKVPVQVIPRFGLNFPRVPDNMASASWLLAVALSLPLTTALGVSSALEGVRFRKIATGLLPQEGLVAEVANVRSNPECAKTCMTKFSSCRSYGYAKGSRECHVFSQSFGMENLTRSSYGFSFYVMVAAGSRCESDADCPEDHFQCRNASCQCVIGYHLSPRHGTCVERCSSYGSGYYRIDNWCLNAHNDKSNTNGIGFQECYDWCMSDPKCRTFEHSVNLCFISYSTKIEAEASWKFCEILSYHQRDCA